MVDLVKNSENITAQKAHQTIHFGLRPVKSTSDYTLRTLYPSYFKGISAKIELPSAVDRTFDILCLGI
jgi:hypothetical protein